ncbi:MAG: hypothetical protein UU47_C0011G0001 [candidate division TM6 bacterium GW2011_GWE2_41_16]|nr:MAG: hypothetical protein UU47_C0011G0001 [candidate division TM6 bacterium GW2011_GWE2_41_16]
MFVKTSCNLIAITVFTATIGLSAQNTGFESNRTRRPDTTLLTYYLKRSGASVPQPLCIIMQDSAKESVLPQSKDKIETPLSAYEYACTRALNSTMHVLLIEKAGIDGILCRDKEFHSLNTIRQRSQDVLTVTTILKDTLGNSWDGSTVIIAQEEGAEVAALLVPYLWRVRKVLVIGSTLEWPLSTVLEQTYLKEHKSTRKGFAGQVEDRAQKAYLLSQIALIRTMRSPNVFFQGKSHAYWAARLDYAPGRDLRKCRAPMLVLAGSLDETVPLQACDDFAAMCLKEHAKNIKVCSYDGLNHHLQNYSAQVPQTVISEIDAWFAI